jgi:pimeloyl-ACP methyl ester carboxylesterase/predicted secreted protein
VNESIKKNPVNLKAKTTLTFLLIAVFIIAALSGTQLIQKVVAIDYTEYKGTLDGADWALRIPDPWNGMLVVVCRGSSGPVLPNPLSTLNLHTYELEKGFAVAASNYGSAGFCLQAGVNSTYELTRYVIDNYNVTGRVFLNGASLGGIIALLVGEKYSYLYSGILDMMGIKDLEERYIRLKRWANLSDAELEAEMIAMGITTIPPPTFATLEDYRIKCSNASRAIELATGGTPETHPQEYENLSPTYHANITIPVITVHGTDDAIVAYYQSLMYNASVANAGCSNLYRLYTVTGGGHNGGTLNEAPERFMELVEWANSMWGMTYGGPGDDTGTGETVQTSDGGYAISGDTNSSGAGGFDFWLFKTDADGNMEWNQTYGGVLDETIHDMCQTIDGGYAMSGTTESFGAGSTDAYLVKTDADGNMEWNMTYGGAGDDEGRVVIQTSDGGYAMTGHTTSYGAGDFDAWLIKIDADGNMEWNMTYGGTGDEDLDNLLQTDDEGYLFAGQTNSFGAGGIDGWLVKTDASGNMLWNKTYGSTGIDITYTIAVSGDGGYVLTGFTNSFGGYKIYFVKTDEDGNMLWNKTYATKQAEIGIHGILTSDDGYVIVGWNYANGQDFVLYKINATYDLEWNMTYGGPGLDNAYAVLEDSDGGYVLTGTTDSFGAGGTDILLVKVDKHGVIPESFIPEGFTIAIVVLLSTVSVAVSFWLLRKRPKLKNSLLEKP